MQIVPGYCYIRICLCITDALMESLQCDVELTLASENCIEIVLSGGIVTITLLQAS